MKKDCHITVLFTPRYNQEENQNRSYK